MLRPLRASSGFVLSAVTLAAWAQPPGFEPVPLPEGEGKAEVEAACVACHQTNLIVGSAGYTQDGWRYLTSKMIALEEPLGGKITQYLATHFPPRNDRQPKLVPGPVEVTFQEWTVPTLGQRPRDPLQLEDGTIWWAGMYASLIGRLDPASGEMREYRLDPAARPHSIVADRDDNIWYTGNGNGTVGKLDPETGEVTVYRMPDPAARDPHTPIFNRDGDLWFTLQNSNMLGRLVPATGEIDLLTLPTERARPYGIKEDSKGNLWIAYNGSNKIARVNPATREIREFATPTPESRIRRLALTSDDIVWYVDSARGYLGRLDPATGDIETWPSPSGPGSHPYAIEVVNDVVWYNESNQRPDALVRFDPATETFQSWAIPSGVGIIRHMRATPDGNLVIHQSSTNTVGLVRIGKEASQGGAARWNGSCKARDGPTGGDERSGPVRSVSTETLRGLLTGEERPCISLYQPTLRAHPERQQNPIRYRNLLRSMERSLTDKYPEREMRPLLDRFEALADDATFWNFRTDGLAVLGSPERFELFDLQRSVPELVVVADSFHVKPLLRVVQSADRYQILCLSRREVKLYEGNRDTLDPVELENVPATIEEALGEEHTEGYQTFHSIGPFRSRNGAVGIRHGTGERKDDVGIDAERFFRAVDRAILEHYSRPTGLPLLLVGLPENLAIFRAVTRNPHVMDAAIELDPDSLTLEALRTRAWREVEPFYLQRLAQLTERYGLERSRGLGADDLADIARAAVAGRVDTVLIEAERLVPGRMDRGSGEIEWGTLEDPSTDDLLDDIAERVLRTRGEAIVVPAERMPSRTGAAAIYRF